MTVEHTRCYLRNKMQIKTQNVDIDFQLKEHMSDIGIRISGGLDSALVLYMLCTYINETQKDLKIFPMTTNDFYRPYQVEFADRVIKWMKRQFPDVFFYDHDTYNLKEGEDYIEGQYHHKIRAGQQFYEKYGKRVDIVLHGVNLAPPSEIVETFVNQDGKPFTGPKDNRNISQDPWDMEKKLYKPLVNLDKKGIAEIYDYYNLTDTLFYVTRSCECGDTTLTNNLTTHCETECWWCFERKWGFGKI